MKNSRFDVRITSIWQHKKMGNTIFAGVPINNGVQASAKKLIVVTVPTCQLSLQPTKGQHWRVSGQVENRQVVGHNGFKINQVHVAANRLRVTMPDTGDNFISFVATSSDFNGIGNIIAEKIWNKFQKNIYSILNAADVDSLRLCLSEFQTESLLKGWKKYSNLKYLEWFSDNNIPPSISSRVVKYHEEKSIKLIQNNPYKLITFGMKFNDVDNLAKDKFNIAKDDERRLSAAVEMSLYKQISKGHTFSSHSVLYPEVRKVLDDTDLTSKALQAGFHNEDFVLIEGNYHLKGMWLQEKVVALRLLKLSKNKNSNDFSTVIDEAASDLPYPLTDKQYDAVRNSLQYDVSVVTGGAGTGKTTVLRTIIKAHNNLGYTVFPMALSGRAAKRIRESTGFKSSTIARFLRSEELEPDAKILLVVDESSMIDLSTMYRLVTHTHPTVRFLLVGDPNQLPPIGAGLVLHDIVKANSLPLCELDIVKRQCKTTGIPEYTESIKNGIIPNDLSTGNIKFHEVSLEEINSTVSELYLKSPIDTQIVSATYQAENGGINSINLLCQELYNKDGKQLEFELYEQKYALKIRVGDPIIFTENNLKLDVQNGTLGHLIGVEQTKTGFGTIKLDDGREIELTEKLIDSIKLAYCVSLHKAQGSQFKRVIIPISSARMIDRCWVYTALTRAEVDIEIVGTASMFNEAIKRISSSSLRNTYLHNFLKSEGLPLTVEI